MLNSLEISIVSITVEYSYLLLLINITFIRIESKA